MKPSTMLVLFHVYLLSFSVWAVESDDVGDFNAYLDEVLNNLRSTSEYVEKFDPLEIPEIKEKNYQVSEGIVKGLSHIYRHGDCIISYKDKHIVVSGEVAVENVQVNVKYMAKALFIKVKGKAEGKVRRVAVRFVLAVEDGKAVLKTFKVTHLDSYKITKISGVSVVLNWMLKLIVNSIAKKSRSKIIDAMEKEASKALNDLFKKVDIPLGTVRKHQKLLLA